MAGAAVLALASPLQADPAAVVETYADIAAAAYGDSLTAAEALSAAVDGLVANPTPTTLGAAHAAWMVARVPYMQTMSSASPTRSWTTWRAG